MANANQRVSSNGAIYPAGIFLFAAGLLILLGLVLQAAQIGWGHLVPNNLWLISVIVPGLWNMLAVQWNAPIWQELLKFWPLALVATGIAMLLVRKRAYARELSEQARKGGNQDA
ncbi:MAG: hypothetical protein ACRD59_11515 [Candidatus Acidiferrales bacterium]